MDGAETTDLCICILYLLEPFMKSWKHYAAYGSIAIASALMLTGCASGSDTSTDNTAALLKAQASACAPASSATPGAKTTAPAAAQTPQPAATPQSAVNSALKPTCAPKSTATPKPTTATTKPTSGFGAGPSNYNPGGAASGFPSVDSGTSHGSSSGSSKPSTGGSSSNNSGGSSSSNGSTTPRPVTTTGGSTSKGGSSTGSKPSTGSSSNPKPGGSTDGGTTPPSTTKPTNPPTSTDQSKNFVSLFNEKFTKDAAVGTWSQTDEKLPAYQGDKSIWYAAPSTIGDPNGNPYAPESTLSVKNGLLDINPQVVNGAPAGALLTPAVNGESPYQTYGKYSVTLKTTGNTNPYRFSMALYPASGDTAADGAMIFPDTVLNQTQIVNGYYVYGGNGCGAIGCIAQSNPVVSFDTTKAHTYAIAWTPDTLTYTIDGKTVLNLTSHIPTQPMRLQLAVNSSALNSDKDDSSTHVQVSDVQIWKYKK